MFVKFPCCSACSSTSPLRWWRGRTTSRARTRTARCRGCSTSIRWRGSPTRSSSTNIALSGRNGERFMQNSKLFFCQIAICPQRGQRGETERPCLKFRMMRLLPGWTRRSPWMRLAHGAHPLAAIQSAIFVPEQNHRWWWQLGVLKQGVFSYRRQDPMIEPHVHMGLIIMSIMQDYSLTSRL